MSGEVLRTELQVEQSTQDSLQATLRGDILACDCLLSLFWAALNSYRHDTILRPYPPMYCDPNSNRGDKRTDHLVLIILLTSYNTLTEY